MKKTIVFILGIVLPIFFVQGQYQNRIIPLSIGDTVPDIQFNNIINYKTTSARLSDFKGKLVILDFWSTWCSACISGFPLMDSLKKEFGKELDILMVNTKSRSTGDNHDKLVNTLVKLKTRTGIAVTLPIVYNNSLLDSLFPNMIIPHEVWILRGKVIAITGSSDITREKISSVLSGIVPTMSLKQDIFDFRDSVPLFVNNNGGQGEQITFRSLLSGYVEGLPGRIAYRIDKSDTIRNLVTGF